MKRAARPIIRAFFLERDVIPDDPHNVGLIFKLFNELFRESHNTIADLGLRIADLKANPLPFFASCCVNR